AERAARGIERLAARLGRPLAHDLGFSESEGFYVELDPPSVAATAAPAGYRLGPAGTFPYGHALLVPEAAAPSSIDDAPASAPPTPRRLPRVAAATVRLD